jgi:hypothetical protein
MSLINLDDFINATASATMIMTSHVPCDIENVKQLEYATSANEINYISISYIVPQSPMGIELNNLLFSNQDFKRYYELFANELEEDLDRQYIDREISPMKYYRMKKKITQQELAQIINEYQPHISRWESRRNLHNVPAGTVEKIARALSITVEELLHGPQT